MAFHDRLSNTQRILLAIFCFPLLPFYFCALCYARSHEEQEEGKPTELAHMEAGKTVETQRDSSFTGFQSDGNGNDRSQQPRGNGLPGQPVQMQPDEQAPVITSYTNEGTHVTVEVHPRNTTPQLFKKFSLGKGVRKLPSLTGLDNKGFQENGEGRVPLPGGKDLHAYPWDKSSLKSMTLDLQQFEKLDAYASKVSVKNSIEELVKALLREARNDLEKVRAIWMWICHHIEYDVAGFHNKGQRSCEPKDVLHTGKSVCEGYAGLFQQMCSVAGVRCMKLSGYSKGYSYRRGQSFTGDSDHAWNAVYLDGRWHLLDSTWGSGSVNDSCSKFTFQYKEFYFLTHPALFINNHFPDNSNWQLLKPALTLKEFESNMLYNSQFYILGMLATHPETPIIQTVNGKATISIESRAPLLFMFKLQGTEEHGLMTLKKNGMKLEIYPQKTGNHKLQVFAKPAKGSEDHYNEVLEYTIECSSVDKNMCFPKDLRQPVGPSWFTERKGFLRPSHPEPIIHTNDGRCSITFTLGKDISILPSLHSDNTSLTEDMRRRHIMEIHRGNQIEFKIHLPHAGKFVLRLFAKKKSDPGNYNYIFNYLISCPNTEVKWPVFPEYYRNWAESYELLEPLAGLLPANRNVQFKLKLHSIAKAFVKGKDTSPLTLSKDGYWEGTCNTSGCTEVCVMVQENANLKFSYLLKYEVETQ
ncbi:kyphoscoliosis peptidase isoform X1 [Gopherus evgoodei]|uniref:kyphoscoliosis peptidase isoform X1 n=1 Tax=Gopherus evgoodei TaxID=1825980 RepID=UPI0011CF029C|nr:kyphoscoliosis peptidase isoform X1 [Gopherus evgoodei]XP_030432250.1 kyphoscoliosis peptidase isoform X1 [Gopherus evgoodei]